MFPERMTNMSPTAERKPRFFKQPERIVKLYNAELTLGKSIFAKKREQSLITPLYPLLGFPNTALDGYDQFINRKLNR
jgi:hypothetical protein